MVRVECSVGAYTRISIKFTPQFGELHPVIQRNTYKVHFLNVNSGLFDTRLNILTNVRYAMIGQGHSSKVTSKCVLSLNICQGSLQSKAFVQLALKGI